MTPAFGLHLVTLGVADLEKAVAFYTAMGLARRDQGSDKVAFFDASGVVLSLFDRSALAADAGLTDASTPLAGTAAPTDPAPMADTARALSKRSFSGIALAFNVADEEAVGHVMAAAEGAGATIVKTPQRAFWGGFSGYFADPDGHIWEVAHNPFWLLDAAGRPVLPD
ncbi:VOC family protein [Azorhizobium sp. AG788]|uniref:VOC family protein n=1 Tax=Azorhizobium sp. AG788 TaxID=2183897 RepID=UPI0031398F82